MTDCICPEDGRQVNSSDRMYIMEPEPYATKGGPVRHDASKVLIFNKHCPVHGYTVLDEEETPDGD